MDSVTDRFLAARKRREIRTERVELEASIPERVAALELRMQTVTLALIALQSEAMTPSKVINTIDKLKAG